MHHRTLSRCAGRSAARNQRKTCPQKTCLWMDASAHALSTFHLPPPLAGSQLAPFRSSSSASGRGLTAGLAAGPPQMPLKIDFFTQCRSHRSWLESSKKWPTQPGEICAPSFADAPANIQLGAACVLWIECVEGLRRIFGGAGLLRRVSRQPRRVSELPFVAGEFAHGGVLRNGSLTAF